MATAKTQLRDVKGWADRLACPVCFQPLRFEAEHVACTGCGRVYPIVDGIPVLIAERAAGPPAK
jgi:uncharacterized protein